MTTLNEFPKTKSIPFLLILFYVSVAVIVLVFLLRINVSQKDKIAQKKENNVVEINAPTAEEKGAIEKITEQVVPKSGFKFNIKWGDIGKKLVENGAIDLDGYRENYPEEKYKEELKYLTDGNIEGIIIDANSAYFWVNTLWALGLNQQSKVLTDMKNEYPKDIGNLASTGGWTLGTKDALELYNKEIIISLTDTQQEIVKKISAGIFRPCCNNSTAFPDCNHGMAALGLIELMVSQNFSEEEIYRAVLAFNSYWFSQTYIDLAYYFQKNENTSWSAVDPKVVLSEKYSSSSGYGNIKKQIGNIPGVSSSGAGCGV
jgi:hypothetical protein